MTRRARGTTGHGLVMEIDMSDCWLDLMILKDFSNLDDSVIQRLWYFEDANIAALRNNGILH